MVATRTRYTGRRAQGTKPEPLVRHGRPRTRRARSPEAKRKARRKLRYHCVAIRCDDRIERARSGERPSDRRASQSARSIPPNLHYVNVMCVAPRADDTSRAIRERALHRHQEELRSQSITVSERGSLGLGGYGLVVEVGNCAVCRRLDTEQIRLRACGRRRHHHKADARIGDFLGRARRSASFRIGRPTCSTHHQPGEGDGGRCQCRRDRRLVLQQPQLPHAALRPSGHS